MIMIFMMSIDHDHNFHADQEDHHHDYHGQDGNDDHFGVIPIHPSLLKLLSVFSVLCGGATSLTCGICIGIWMNWPNWAKLTSSRELIHRGKSRRPNLFPNPASLFDAFFSS